MSPGVATPCPAAPPIPIAKVCFITPSLAESRPIHEARAVGRAQVKVCKSVRATPPPNEQLAFPSSRVYTQSFRLFSSARELGARHALVPRSSSPDSRLPVRVCFFFYSSCAPPAVFRSKKAAVHALGEQLLE